MGAYSRIGALGLRLLTDPEEITEWKEKYLNVWDGYIDQLEPKPRKAQVNHNFDAKIEGTGQ